MLTIADSIEWIPQNSRQIIELNKFERNIFHSATMEKRLVKQLICTGFGFSSEKCKNTLTKYQPNNSNNKWNTTCVSVRLRPAQLKLVDSLFVDVAVLFVLYRRMIYGHNYNVTRIAYLYTNSRAHIHIRTHLTFGAFLSFIVFPAEKIIHAIKQNTESKWNLSILKGASSANTQRKHFFSF